MLYWHKSANADALEQFKDQRSREKAAVHCEMSALVHECERVNRILAEKDREIAHVQVSAYCSMCPHAAVYLVAYYCCI